MSPAFNRVLIGVTVINVLVLCVDHHGISDDLNDNLLLINFACNIVFIAELFIKLWGLGGRVYFGDPFNCFDCLLVLVSIPETVSGEGSALSAFRVFRIMRVLRLVRRLRTLRSILSAILRSLSSASSLCLIMLLFTFVYTVLGLQLFTKSYPSEHRSNFESLWHAALTVFVVLTGEQWSKIMKIAMGATTPAAALYFITLFWLGNYIFVNLFIAILIDTFSQETMQVRAAKAEEANDDDTCTKAWTASPETISKTIARRHSFPDSLLAVSGSSSRTSEWSPANWKPRKVSGDNFVNPFKAAVARRASSSLPHPVAELSPLTGTSLKLFSPQSKIRIACSKVVLHPHFESCVLVLIFLNVASLVLEGPWLDRQPEVRGALRWAEYGFAVVFACEAVLKIIVVGLWQQSPLPSAGGLPARKVPSVSPIDLDELRVPYLRSTWNRVDFTVVITAILGLFVPFFATFRSLRSLRLIIRNGNIKVVVSAVLQALPAIGNVVLVVSFTCLVFAVLGVQLFKGSFYSCNDPAVTLKSECTGVFDEAVSVDAFGEFIVRSNVSRSWENEGTHFDHIGAAFLTLFEVGIGDGWAEIMYLGVDSESNDEAPRRDRHPVKSIYFVCFVIAGSFFAINLFVGLLIDRFNDLKRQLDGSALLTQEQRDWVRYNKTMRRIKLKPKTITVLGCRGAVNRFVTHPWFDLAISACIVINISVMCTKHYNQSDLETGIQQNTNFFFVAVFTVEALLKLYAWRRVYFDDPWNRFDFLLVTLSVIGMFFGNESVQAFRILRICRILRLIKRAQGLQKLFTTLYFALPSLFNLSLLLLVVYLNFGVTGVELFGRVRRHGSITKWINFENMGSAVMTLYTISTTELWAEVMKDVRRKTECEGEDTCGSEWAVVFFPSFMIVGQMIALNLVITVVLENFGELESLAETRNIVRALSHFRELWLEIDSFATGQLNLDQFILVIKDVPPPLGLQNPESFWELNYVLHHMEIAIDTAGLIRYDDVVSAFLRVAFHIKMHDLKQLKQYTGQVEDSEQQRGSPFLVNQWYCAQRIQQFFRKSRARARAGGQQAADRDDRGNPPGAVAPHLFCAKRGGFGDPARRDNADGSPPTPLLAALLCPAPTNPLACRPAAHRQPGDRDNHPGCRPKDGVFELPLRSPGHSAADDLRSSDGGWARSPAAVPSGGCRDGPPGEGGGAPESPDNEYSGEAVFFAPRTEPSEGERQSHAAAVCSREALCEGEAPSVGDDDFGRPSARQHAFQNNTEHSDDERRSHAADTSRSPAVVLFTSFRNAQRTDSAAPSAAIGSVASARNVSNITQTNDNDLADGMQHTLRAMPSVSMGPVASSISLANADYADGSHDTLPSVSNGAAAFAQNPSIHALPSVPIRPVTSVYNMSRSAQPSDGADDSPMPTVTNGAVTFVQSPSNADDDGADGVQSTLRAMPSVTMRPVTSVYNMSRSAQPSDGPDDPPAMPSVANGAVTLVHNPSIADEGDAGGLQNAVRAMPSVTMRPVTSVYNLSSLAQPGGGADDSHDNLHTMFPIASPCASTAALGYDRANSAYNSLCAMPSLRPGTSLHNFSTGAQGAGDADGSHCTPRGLPCPTIEPHMSSGNLSTVAPVRVSSGNLSNLARGPDCQSLRAARGAVESSYNLSHAAHGSRADLTGDDRNSVRATLSAVAPTDSYYNSLNVARGSRVEATVGDDPAGALTAMNASSMCSLSNAARGSRMDANGDEHADGFHAMHSAIGPVASAYDLSNAARGSRMDLTGEDNSDASRTLHTTSTAVGNASRFHELRHTSCASNTALSPEQEASASPVSCLTDTASPSYTASETRPQHCSPKIPESQCSPSRASSKASPVASKAQASKLDVDSAGTVVSSDGVSSCADAAVDVGEKMEVSNTAVRGHDDENALTDAAASAKAAARPSATHLLPPPTARDGNPAPSLPYDGSGHGVASGSDCGT
ncbi:Voltage-dependent calcium channel type D subunit alpha-1 [Diplonema papillatum]|nr:Voltage-dependent calcium channel type D subunit alpha-1 [Diplonema papillatum]